MSTKSRSLRPEDVDKIAQADEARHAYFFRDPDRPDGKFVKDFGRVPPEVKKAQARLRTAHWRSEMDRKRRPTASQFGLALATALATTSNLRALTADDRSLVQRALHDLLARGFSIDEAKKTMRRLRLKMMDPADREGEADENCGSSIRIPEELPEELPF